uniref:Uncharacterized protein n=1 Tax=Glossina brevipalpis TaxID=37001 RepID=A0A1A9W0W0_9MUSC
MFLKDKTIFFRLKEKAGWIGSDIKSDPNIYKSFENAYHKKWRHNEPSIYQIFQSKLIKVIKKLPLPTSSPLYFSHLSLSATVLITILPMTFLMASQPAMTFKAY